VPAAAKQAAEAEDHVAAQVRHEEHLAADSIAREAQEAAGSGDVGMEVDARKVALGVADMPKPAEAACDDATLAEEDPAKVLHALGAVVVAQMAASSCLEPGGLALSLPAVGPAAPRIG